MVDHKKRRKNNQNVATIQSQNSDLNPVKLLNPKAVLSINMRDVQESLWSNWSSLIPAVAVPTRTTQQVIVLLEMNSHSLKCKAGGVEEELTWVHMKSGLRAERAMWKWLRLFKSFNALRTADEALHCVDINNIAASCMKESNIQVSRKEKRSGNYYQHTNLQLRAEKIMFTHGLAHWSSNCFTKSLYTIFWNRTRYNGFQTFFNKLKLLSK